MKIKLQERHLYGRMVYYPQDDLGQRLLKILNQKNRKCFAHAQLSAIKDLGYEVEIQPFQYITETKHGTI